MDGGCGPRKQADAASRRSRRATPGAFQALPRFGSEARLQLRPHHVVGGGLNASPRPTRSESASRSAPSVVKASPPAAVKAEVVLPVV